MKLLRHTKTLLLLVAAMAALFVQSCRDFQEPTGRTPADAFDNKVFLRWNELFLEIDRYAKGYRPGPAPRALGYLGLSAYESVVAGMPQNNSLESYFPGLDVPEAEDREEYYWPACVNESYAFLMTRFFFHMENEYPALFQKIEQTRKQLHDEFVGQIAADILERSESFGQSVASAVYEWEKLDAAGHNAFLNPQPLDYTPPQGPGLWQPTYPDFNLAMFPRWTAVRTFALRETDKLAKPPIPYSETPGSLFFDQAEEVYNIVNFIKNPGPNLDDQALAYDLRWKAIFWSDDILNFTFSPPARLIAITNQVIEKEHTNLAVTAELYAKIGLALHDAGVAIWHSKYYYNVERPVSYIRRILSKYPQQYPNAATWTTILDNPYTGFDGITPAFPAYPSGHSGFGSAGGKILSSFFEYNNEHPGTYSFIDLCHESRTDFIGTPRPFTSFAQMAKENADSRVPLGVHFQMDCNEGVRIGEVAAQRVLEMAWKK